jgi:tetratricopeptide (TPR) repeat protein
MTTHPSGPSRIELPPVPSGLRGHAVACWAEPLVIDTYMPLAPDSKPAFFEQRVYQGSTGAVFPLPFHERVSQEKEPHAWTALHLENEWLRVVVLPELGGRIHIGYDKVAGYDFFYRNNVIKPALVGLAGPWISGGVEFNWPQHHRPATFLPTDFEIEHEDDGSVTVWCSDHDPFTRMKGMHGIRLRPDSAAIEARVRLYNRTEETQTFLWWANVAVAVDDQYQAFFPTDVDQVADHAKRATASYPAVTGSYYGVEYPAQRTEEVPDGDRLDWYRNITVPTSYMVTKTEDDFFGGYDHGRGAGFVHWADRHYAPGKKLWTWGDAPFGHAWDAALTDGDGPYIELMAGVFTDNQPDFSFLAPGETKTFSQFWYPIHQIGPAHQATTQLAVRLDVEPGVAGTEVVIGVAAAELLPGSIVELRTAGGGLLHCEAVNLVPGAPLVRTLAIGQRLAATGIVLTVRQGENELIRWQPRAHTSSYGEVAEAATEPPAPEEVGSVDELFFIGQYLRQYRHATRLPEPYWLEALRRDSGDVRSNIALAERATWAGDLAQAEDLLRTAISRIAGRVSNPADGEAHYRLGIVLTRAGRDGEAERSLAKACWNSAWRVPAGFALAKLKARARRYDDAATELRQVLALDSAHLQAADLLARVLRALGSAGEAEARLKATLQLDPLDQWARDLEGLPLTADAPTLLDVAVEYSSAGFTGDALRVLDLAAVAAKENALGQVQVAPLVHYHRAALLEVAGRSEEARAARTLARYVDRFLCQPSRTADVAVLQDALVHDDGDSLAAMLLGNWHYDKRRYAEAIELWQRASTRLLAVEAEALSAQERDSLVILLRNLGIAAYNVHSDGGGALEAYERARLLAPDDAKLLVEYDQLAARLGASGQSRLERFEELGALVESRDDLSVVYSGLLTDAGRAADARRWLLSRVFQPWEGGEGQALGAWDAANIALAEKALFAGDAAAALGCLDSAVDSPASLGEARHPLANAARLQLLRGDALAALGRVDEATTAWEHSASFQGDFQAMNVQSYSEQSCYSAMALRKLGRTEESEQLIDGIAGYLHELAATPATIGHFATSLPTMLLFTEDPQIGRDRLIAQLRAQLDVLRGLTA